jgi:hypothetical protein
MYKILLYIFYCACSYIIYIVHFGRDIDNIVVRTLALVCAIIEKSHIFENNDINKKMDDDMFNNR